MWLHNKKTGALFNTDWINEDARRKESNILYNKAESNKLTFKETGVLSGNDVKEVDSKIIEHNKEVLKTLGDKFPQVRDYLGESGCQLDVLDHYPEGDEGSVMTTKLTYSNGRVLTSQIAIINTPENEHIFKSFDSLKQYEEQSCNENEAGVRWGMPCDKDKYGSYLLSHEYGHAVVNYILDKNNREIWKDAKKYYESFESADRALTRGMYQNFIRVAKKNGIKLDMSQLSAYGIGALEKGQYSEILAESFAHMMCSSSPNCWGQVMQLYLKELKLL